MKGKIYVLVVGSRTFHDYLLLKATLNKILSPFSNIIIVSGGARGADTLAKIYAEDMKYEYIEFPANWNLYGKSAGFIRNEEMHKFISQYENRICVAFWDGKSKGTSHNFALAKKYNNPIEIINYIA